MKYRIHPLFLVALLGIGAFFVVNAYAADKTQPADAEKPATEEVTLSVTGMT